MAKEIQNPNVSLERHPPNYPLIFIGGFILLCLIAGLILSAGVQAWSMFLLFLLSVVGLAAFGYFNFVQSLRSMTAFQRIDWNPALPEIQKQNLNVEVEEIAKTLQLDPWQTTELLSAYIVAEDLALRQIQQEQNAPLMRHVSIGKASFDAVITKGDLITCIEVAFLVAPQIRQEKITAMLKKAASLRRFIEAERHDLKIHLLIVLVTQLTPNDENHLRSKLGKDRFSDTAVDIDIRLLDFEALQRAYVTDK